MSIDEAALNAGLPPISSVLSQGRTDALVMPGYPTPYFPKKRPHYE